MQLHDTIVAISSPPGPAARGIVRLSGPDSHRLAATVFTPCDGASFETRPPFAIDGDVRLDGAALPACAWLFAEPKSYTRQDMVELHLLGSPGVLGLIVEALIAAGARRAEAGEFTARAYLNGALDLAQVHGVAALVSAQSEGQRRAAARLLEGSLSKTAHAAREELADLLSLVEGALDFADEPIEFITPGDLQTRLAAVSASLRQTLEASLQSERWGRAPHVLLAGLPNAGKSSLLNRLSGMERAIAAPIAGTTRDTLTAPLQIDDLICILVDSAGMNDVVEHLNQLAMSAAQAAAADADLLLWVIDASEPPQSSTQQWRKLQDVRKKSVMRVVVVLNKIDLAPPHHIHSWSEKIRNTALDAPVLVSAATGAGCDDLRQRLAGLLATHVELDHASPIALAGEHHDALQRAVLSLDRAMGLSLADSASLADADLVALELHTAADALGVLVGKDVPDDLLGRVFARFCVGK